jgi:hypothetical protein
VDIAKGRADACGIFTLKWKVVGAEMEFEMTAIGSGW